MALQNVASRYILQLAAAAVAAAAGTRVVRALLQQQQRRRHGLHTMHVPLPPPCTQADQAGGQIPAALRHELAPGQQTTQQAQLMTVYLLPEDESACTAALTHLLPQLLPMQTTDTQSCITRPDSKNQQLEAVAEPTGARVSLLADSCSDNAASTSQAAITPQAASKSHAAGTSQVAGTSQAATTSRTASTSQAAGTAALEQPPQQGQRMGNAEETEVQFVLGIDAEWQPEELPDPRIAKVGVGIQEDIRRIATDFGIQAKGAVDVRAVAQLVCPDVVSALGSSLSALTQAVVGRMLDKQQQRSAWGSARLTQAQITYAAQDAWASRQLLLDLYTMAAATDAADTDDPADTGGAADAGAAAVTDAAAIADGERAAEENQQLKDWKQAASLSCFVRPFVDIFKRKHLQQAINAAGSARGQAWPFHLPGLTYNGSGTVARNGRAAGNEQYMYSKAASIGSVGSNLNNTGGRAWKKPPRHALRKTKLYENCRLQAPDGQVLCTCSLKKVHWYVERGLGSMVCDDPVTVRLHFAPRGRGHQDDNYYTSDKINQCVVCGSTTDTSAEHHQPGSRADSRCSGSSTTDPARCSTPDMAMDTTTHMQPDDQTGPPEQQFEPEHADKAGSAPKPSSVQQGLLVQTSAVSEEEDEDRSMEGIQEGKQDTEAGMGGGIAAGQGDADEDDVTCALAGAGAGADKGSAGSESYLRHSVVPPSYRRCFPVSFKSHLSHDIVLLCLQCAQVCSVHDQKRMAWLGEVYGAPLSLDKTKFKYDEGVASIRSAARALLNSKVELPAERKSQLEATVAAHFGVPPYQLDDTQLQQAAMLDPRKPTSQWSSHAACVVSCLKSAEDIEAFVRGWRQHFLDTMQPRFLPPHWSIDARVANSSVDEVATEQSKYVLQIG